MRNNVRPVQIVKSPLAAHTCPRWLAATLCLVALAAILALAWWAYHPGLTGDFLFDDFGNLPALGATGPVDNWATFWRYITSGRADPTGRPLTLLSFLIDARNWPASPYPFKVTNVVLHLINGALLAWVLWWLGKALVSARAMASPRAARDPLPAEGGKTTWWPALAALFGAGAWLLHPLFVSTTLYIVQREAMLPATFTLIGILCWIAARDALVRGHVKRGLIGMAVAAWLCTLLAVLSKANGALLPLLLLLIDWIVLAPRRPMPDVTAQSWYKRAVTAFLVIPGALVLAYLLYLLPGAIHRAPELRDWTIGERLLTESRVVADYLRLLVVPHAHSSGLFNDAFATSTGWLHPASTIPCVILIAAMISVGFTLRKRHPAIALALLFYFTAQLMESGWIPLELYYEHRNYLPAMLLFWPIGIGLARPGILRSLRIASAAGLLMVLATLTWQRATLWGDGFRQALVWAAINPDSARSQANAALYDLHHDRPRLAAARLRLSLAKHPDDIQAPINLISAECRLGGVQPKTLTAANNALARTRLGGAAAFKWFNDALAIAASHACPGLDFAALQTTLDAVRRNPHWHDISGRQQDIHHLQAQLYLAEGKPKLALEEFNRALAAQSTPDVALEQAAYLGAKGFPELGLQHLDHYATLSPGKQPGLGMPSIHAWVLREQGWWPKETAYLRNTLATDAAAKQARRHAK